MLVLDANILIRAVLGSKVLLLLLKYAEHVEFMAPDLAFKEAREHLPGILVARKIAVAPAMEMLDLVSGLVQTVEYETYSRHEAIALRAHRSARQGRLAGISFRTRAGLPYLDRRHGLFRLRCGNMDDRSSGVIPGEDVLTDSRSVSATCRAGIPCLTFPLPLRYPGISGRGAAAMSSRAGFPRVSDAWVKGVVFSFRRNRGGQP